MQLDSESSHHTSSQRGVVIVTTCTSRDGSGSETVFYCLAILRRQARLCWFPDTQTIVCKLGQNLVHRTLVLNQQPEQVDVIVATKRQKYSREVLLDQLLGILPLPCFSICFGVPSVAAISPALVHASFQNDTGSVCVCYQCC